MKNCGDNVFGPAAVGPGEATLVEGYLDDQDFAANTRRAVIQDLRKFAAWFAQANAEPFRIKRVTTRDITDFKDGLRRQQGQAVATINRALVTLRRFFAWLVDHGHAQANPVKPVKELRKQQLAPKGMERGEVRRLLREIELRQDVRAGAIFSLFLYTGCRVSDLAALELHDLMLGERGGSVVFRLGKGNKQRSVPLPLPARRAVQAYLETRPSVDSGKVFVGERGPLTDRGVRALCDKYSALDRRQAASSLTSPHDGPSILGEQSWRSRRAGPDSRSRIVEHNGQIHKANRGAVGRCDGEVDVLRRRP